MLALVGQKPAEGDAALQLAAIVRRRAVDKADALMLLDALGLLGDVQPPAHSGTAAWTHGSQAGVDRHVELGQGPCRACARWLEVAGRRAERSEPPVQACGDAVGTAQGYWRHKGRYRRQVACERCLEAYRVYQLEQAARKRAAR